MSNPIICTVLAMISAASLYYQGILGMDYKSWSAWFLLPSPFLRDAGANVVPVKLPYSTEHYADSV